jgi:hypothetical protein
LVSADSLTPVEATCVAQYVCRAGNAILIAPPPELIDTLPLKVESRPGRFYAHAPPAYIQFTDHIWAAHHPGACVQCRVPLPGLLRVGRGAVDTDAGDAVEPGGDDELEPAVAVQVGKVDPDPESALGGHPALTRCRSVPEQRAVPAREYLLVPIAVYVGQGEATQPLLRRHGRSAIDDCQFPAAAVSSHILPSSHANERVTVCTDVSTSYSIQRRKAPS